MTDLAERLAAAGARLAQADADRAAALEEIAALLAERGDMTLKRAAELAGITRVTAYRLLEKNT